MSFDRKILKVETAYDAMEGGGVMISRALPHRRVAVEEVDPFLLLDEAHIDPKGPGFPEHPHRGFEILTYILDGWGSHADNLGNKGRIEKGGIMRLTAGSGIWHGEQAGGEKGEAHGIQFWVNLPRKEKGRKPEFQLLQGNEIPEKEEKGSLTRVLVGPDSPIQIVTPMQYLDVKIDAGADWSWELDPTWKGYAYVLEGQGKFGADEDEAEAKDLAILGEGGGLKVKNSGSSPLRFLLAAGAPIGEKPVWNGPFVD